MRRIIFASALRIRWTFPDVDNSIKRKDNLAKYTPEDKFLFKNARNSLAFAQYFKEEKIIKVLAVHMLKS